MLPLKQFEDFISEHQLFEKDDRILLAVSGGKDSVLMFHLFKAIGVKFAVAHCNFNLRADEAQRDENFVKLLCASLNIPFYVTHFDTKKYANENKISTQMAARNLRYQWFEEVRLAGNFDYIALAQHQNDAVETVLINLVRGTGIAGLHGILPKRDRLIRPLLFLNRGEIDFLVDENDLDFVEDSSNLSVNYTRNKLRLRVIPQLKEINPNLEHTFAQNINRFAQLEAFLNIQIQNLSEKILIKKNNAYYILIDEILKLNPQKLLMFELLKPFHFTETVIDEIFAALKGQTGKIFLSNTHQAVINRGDLIISEVVSSAARNQFVHSTDDEITFNDFEFKLSYPDQLNFEAVKHKSYLDRDHLIFPLILRNWQQGDKFIPLGMRGFKKLSDYFIDEKLPLHLKNSIPILVNGNGEIIWIVGMRQDNRYKLTKATKKVAIFELKID
ncbi:tRNA lysidine(34) synthetase TilS [Pedobacter changchengzhani]|uniref:tRNA(Ile)-lysidine synthase n=1 Tax=Pedobacter changchengzhani TaxID=2529274 RepID=A0A4V2ZZW4_9SPHI|nr:tRNA lysidine(34) synthetase TilS [Pedobacter changchengzhani]TDG35193.1 tRNA lysidine(34) synthetase TilS [Pedobacter changchengzhani]